ncbi:hypothetical protein ACQKWADRAFT_312529 [Trichoderma austrokoningii]
MSIDLSHLPRMKATATKLTFDGSVMNITIKITNESPLNIIFEHCLLKLKQNQHTIGGFYGKLQITHGECEVEFCGNIQDWVSGMETLKGDEYTSCFGFHESWKQYAIKLFEVEVNLDNLDGNWADNEDVAGDNGDE